MDHIKKLREQLNHFGRASYRPISFENNGVNYATIELMIKREIAIEMEQELNRQCDAENEGARSNCNASFRFIELKELGDGNYLYAAEIHPYSRIPKSRWRDVSEDLVKRLPGFLRDFSQKYHRKI